MKVSNRQKSCNVRNKCVHLRNLKYLKFFPCFVDMVLLELGSKITSALQKMTKSTVIDEKVVDELVSEIVRALLAADVNVKLVAGLRKNIKEKIKLDEMPAGVNKRKAVQKAVTEEIIKLLDSGKKPRQPRRGQPNVIMFVGSYAKKTIISYYIKKLNEKKQ